MRKRVTTRTRSGLATAALVGLGGLAGASQTHAQQSAGAAVASELSIVDNPAIAQARKAAIKDLSIPKPHSDAVASGANPSRP